MLHITRPQSLKHWQTLPPSSPEVALSSGTVWSVCSNDTSAVYSCAGILEKLFSSLLFLATLSYFPPGNTVCQLSDRLNDRPTGRMNEWMNGGNATVLMITTTTSTTGTGTGQLKVTPLFFSRHKLLLPMIRLLTATTANVNYRWMNKLSKISES